MGASSWSVASPAGTSRIRRGRPRRAVSGAQIRTSRCVRPGAPTSRTRSTLSIGALADAPYRASPTDPRERRVRHLEDAAGARERSVFGRVISAPADDAGRREERHIEDAPTAPPTSVLGRAISATRGIGPKPGGTALRGRRRRPADEPSRTRGSGAGGSRPEVGRNGTWRTRSRPSSGALEDARSLASREGRGPRGERRFQDRLRRRRERVPGRAISASRRRASRIRPTAKRHDARYRERQRRTPRCVRKRSAPDSIRRLRVSTPSSQPRQMPVPGETTSRSSPAMAVTSSCWHPWARTPQDSPCSSCEPAPRTADGGF